jgi:hypothetical protein
MLALFGAALLGTVSGLAQNEAAFAEVYGLIRSNLTDLSSAELNRAAIAGLVEQLAPRISLSDADAASDGPAGAETTLLEEPIVFEERHALLRVNSVGPGLASEFDPALSRLHAAHELEGLVIDLRFADGEDYAEAAAVASRFLDGEKTLLTWQDTELRSKPSTNRFTQPVMVLVNSRTAAAAEALAAVLRDAEVALLLGSRTAGQASYYKEFPLSDGRRLKLAVASIRLGNDTALAPEGIEPDIEVAIAPEAERAFLADPFAKVESASEQAGFARTALPPRLTEADLVRLRQEALTGIPDRTATETRPVEAARIVTDPVLARALDLLKGLAVVRPRDDEGFRR